MFSGRLAKFLFADRRCARTTELGQRGFDLGIELVEPGNQLFVPGIETLDKLAR
jgi:hypothetical protein